ncbi:MAG TPA: flagellar basal body P-ring protein FlgI [Bryobacteraceae bacterium]|nr:flagellar basal body P-ring protein FlgI [Bryobacteraceae bacterium]
MCRFIAILACSFAIADGAESLTRLKDLVSLEGVRDNQLLGYGLVVGLKGTGDSRQTVFSAQSLTNLLQRMGVSVSPSAIQVRNTAAVLVTSDLHPFAQPGTRIDVTVSAIGDATNLQGGVLVITALKGPDGEVYAAAQGSVITGGFSAAQTGSSKTVNHPTAGRIPNGAIVERAPPSISPTSHVRLQLRLADFTTAARVAGVINRKFGDGKARAENSGTVVVEAPQEFASRPVEFLSVIENLTVETDRPAKIVVNERTGTIVMGKEVRIAPVAILHGPLTVEIRTIPEVSQPAPLSGGQTKVVPQTTISAKEEKVKSVVLQPGASVEELVRALSAIGSTARDIIAILQSLKAAGAIEAEVEVI